ncbi:hypothetical protein AGABI1DRAFT_114306 [Agaricus bisporus var. burnettii JB137-S8]|uniref:Uncharacterized protein n=1 Tax=Agaricus bisporus var. burnettii (strain JB137-S8 / ATCC MYA-4627 / FGSC 10392) TaxID=597362 RepID=K5XUE4_AGABU|nr:uncharacterized protein AGABI1DRAFT_114306 [Agaricus bisporus var. burnettii JB137-S8]EKM78700.1 hypothetical protein AGABI1DRAFT_114306 [Agaricus bisporus var. burnettii JB137-S8]
MGVLPSPASVSRRQADLVPTVSATGINGDPLIVDPNKASAAPTFAFDTDVAPGGDFTSAPNLVPTHTPIVTLPPTTTASTPTADVSDASATEDASSTSASASPISLSTVVGSCVGAFIGAVALIALGFYFYRRYHRSLKASYRPRGRGPLNKRADSLRRRSHREPWDKLEDSNPEDKWEGTRTAPETTEESVAPMEKLTMFKKSPSVRTVNTAVTHLEEAHFEMPHPFSQQYYLYNKSNVVDRSDTSLPVAEPFMTQGTDAHVVPWNNPAHGSFLSVQTQSEHLSGSMSPSISMAIPTPPATSSPLHHWESAEIMTFDGQSAEVVNTNPFEENKSSEQRKSTENPFFGSHNDQPKRRSRSNSVVSKASRVKSDASSVYIPVPRLDKGKGRAIDPFDDEHAPVPVPTVRPLPPIVTVQATSSPVTSPITPFRPAFATGDTTSSVVSASDNDRAIASLLAALDGDTTEEEVQKRLRIASTQPSVNSTYSVYSETEEEHGRDVTRDFPLPPSTPGHTTPSTINSYNTAETHRTAR